MQVKFFRIAEFLLTNATKLTCRWLRWLTFLFFLWRRSSGIGRRSSNRILGDIWSPAYCITSTIRFMVSVLGGVLNFTLILLNISLDFRYPFRQELQCLNIDGARKFSYILKSKLLSNCYHCLLARLPNCSILMNHCLLELEEHRLERIVPLNITHFFFA